MPEPPHDPPPGDLIHLRISVLAGIEFDAAGAIPSDYHGLAMSGQRRADSDRADRSGTRELHHDLGFKAFTVAEQLPDAPASGKPHKDAAIIAVKLKGSFPLILRESSGRFPVGHKGRAQRKGPDPVLDPIQVILNPALDISHFPSPFLVFLNYPYQSAKS